MKRFTLQMTLASLAIVLLVPGLALAATPDASQSTVDPCLVTCPAGDTNFLVVVRDAGGAVIAGSVVEVDFCNCAGPQLCSPGGSGSCSDGTNDIAILATNSAGEALFHLAEGGDCNGGLVDIRADGVLLAQRTIKAMDTNGDFVADVSDWVGTLSNDYDCNNVLSLSDQVIFGNHASLNHSCTGPVDTAPRSWGSVKALW
jgi:hypothetical protein